MAQSVHIGSIDDFKAEEGRFVEAGGKELAVFRVNGGIYAVDNLCPHQGGPLSEGMVEGDQVICPWHAWVFCMKTGVSPVSPNIRVDTYPVRIQGKDVYVDV